MGRRVVEWGALGFLHVMLAALAVLLILNAKATGSPSNEEGANWTWLPTCCPLHRGAMVFALAALAIELCRAGRRDHLARVRLFPH